jgi:parallel beta-helix repeat protein
MKKLLFFLLLGLSEAQAQVALHVIFGPLLPAFCSPLTGDIYFKTTGGTGVQGLYSCDAVNTWVFHGNGGTSGVSSVTGTTNQITVNAGTGAITISLPSAIVFPGSATATSFIATSGTGAGALILTAGGAPSVTTNQTGWIAPPTITTPCLFIVPLASSSNGLMHITGGACPAISSISTLIMSDINSSILQGTDTGLLSATPGTYTQNHILTVDSLGGAQDSGIPISGQPVNVITYGADPTGVADSLPAFTAALAAGNSVNIPCGTYTMQTGSIAMTASYQTLIGSGECTVLSNENDNTALINFGGNSVGERISGFRINGKSTSASEGSAHYIPLILADVNNSPSYCEIDHIHFTGADSSHGWVRALDVSTTSNCKIHDNILNNGFGSQYATGITVGDGTSGPVTNPSAPGANHTLVYNNQLISPGQVKLAIAVRASTGGNGGCCNSIINNKVNMGTGAGSAGGAGIIIYASTANPPTTPNIDGTQVIGNEIWGVTGASLEGLEAGIQIGGQTSNTLISNNYIHNNSQHGITVEDDTTAGGCNRVMIVHNEIAYNQRNGIYQRGCNDNQILNNYIHDNDQEHNLWTAATNANPVVITTTTVHKFGSGVSQIYVFGGTGAWAALNGVQTATFVSTTTFSIAVDSTGFGSFSGQVMWASDSDGIQLNTNGLTGSTNTVIRGNTINNISSIATVTYVSGVTFGATCTFTLTAPAGTPGTGAVFTSTGSLSTGTLLTLASAGNGYTSSPVTAVLTGTGCSGTPVLTSTITTPTQRYALNIASTTPTSFNNIYGENQLVSGNIAALLDGGNGTQYPISCGFIPCGNSNQTSIGFQALSNNTATEATAFGYQAGLNQTTAVNSTYIGYQAGYSNSTSANNTCIGQISCYYNLASDNTAVGEGSLHFNSSGSHIVAMGDEALYNNTGSNNTSIGHMSMLSNLGGVNNTALGLQAGYGTSSTNANTTGGNNTFLGYESAPGSSTQQNFMTVIGASATGTCSNCIVLGRTTDTVQLPGNQITDINGNNAMVISSIASAVDQIQLTNGATGNPGIVAVSAVGTDSNINLNLVSKGTGTVQINGSNIQTGGSIMSGGCTGVVTNLGTLNLFGFQYSSTGCTSGTNIGQPIRAATVRNLRVQAITASNTPGSGIVAVYKNNVVTAVTCTLGATTTCQDLTDTVTTVSNDQISIRFKSAGGTLTGGPTYVSGDTSCTNGTQIVTFSGSTSGPNPTNAVGTITVTAGVPTGAVTITSGGSGYTAATPPTAGTVATCTGTGVFTGGTVTVDTLASVNATMEVF